MAKQVKAAAGEVTKTWTGKAGDSATSYFTELSDAIGSQCSAIRKMAEQLDQTAIGMYETSESIKDLINMVSDYLLIIVIKLAAAAVASATGVGAIGGAGLIASALVMAKKAWDLVRKIWEILGYAWAGAQATIGLITGHMATVRDAKLPALPAGGYDFGAK